MESTKVFLLLRCSTVGGNDGDDNALRRAPSLSDLGCIAGAQSLATREGETSQVFKERTLAR